MQHKYTKISKATQIGIGDGFPDSSLLLMDHGYNVYHFHNIQRHPRPTSQVFGILAIFKRIRLSTIQSHGVSNVSSVQCEVSFILHVANILAKILLKNKCRKFLSKGWLKDKLHSSWSDIPQYYRDVQCTLHRLANPICSIHFRGFSQNLYLAPSSPRFKQNLEL